MACGRKKLALGLYAGPWPAERRIDHPGPSGFKLKRLLQGGPDRCADYSFRAGRQRKRPYAGRGKHEGAVLRLDERRRTGGDNLGRLTLDVQDGQVEINRVVLGEPQWLSISPAFGPRRFIPSSSEQLSGDHHLIMTSSSKRGTQNRRGGGASKS